MAFVIFGSEDSPYSIKVRSYCRFKNIPHQWKDRNQSNQEEFNKVARLPLVPAVRLLNGKGMQDSTPIMEYFDQQYPTPSAHPVNPALRFLSYLLEEFGDEWGNKWMFHYRWARPIDQHVVALRLAQGMMQPDNEELLVQAAGMIRGRMSGRGFAVGSNTHTGPLIERSFATAMGLLEAHFAAGNSSRGRRFLFGERISFGDFGLGCQIYQALLDPTAGAFLKANAPRVCQWCTTVALGRDFGSATPGWETWPELKPTLEPFLATQVAPFLRWSVANHAAITNGKKEMTVDLGHPLGVWGPQKVGGPQKYQSKSLRALRAKYASVSTNKELNSILSSCGCLDALANVADTKLSARL